MRPPDEAEGRVDREGRADAQEAVGVGDGVVAGLDAGRGHVVAEEDDVGLDHAAALAAGRDVVEARDVVVRVVELLVHQVRVAVGPQRVPRAGAAAQRRGARRERRVAALELRVVRRPAPLGAAGRAPHAVAAAVERDHVLGPRGLVEPVDVLRDDRGDLSPPLEVRERRVARVRRRGAERVVAHERAGPVALPLRVDAHELVVGHGRVALAVRALGAPVVGDAAVRGEARARQRDDPRLAPEPGRELLRRARVVGAGRLLEQGLELAAEGDAGLERARAAGGRGRRRQARRASRR